MADAEVCLERGYSDQAGDVRGLWGYSLHSSQWDATILGKTKLRIFDSIKAANLQFPSDHISASAKDLITGMLCTDPTQRLTASKVLVSFHLNRGTPQIEVTFEVDANGVLNIKAEDKAGVKSEKITITNDKGRLSQEEIDRMVQEAEEFAEEDKKTSLNLEKEKIETAVKEALKWLDENQSAEKDDYDEKLKEVEAVCNPIVTAVYQRSGGAVGVGSGEGEDDDSHDEL
ncbi:hypothetical protein IFM89_026497 [Coptis chinensis]|uniref:Uncharacterized protein n=1 Tax=Coptis chinensis TaxID=261450 RepID=A0A835M484_9MAGN|nr:hypothetical protein IFM89_026497 [Coptis chinensis]